MRYCFIILLLAGFINTSSCPAMAKEANRHLNIDKNHIALKGYDPVSYFSSTPEKGEKTITTEYQGAHYFFATMDNLNKFKADPETYLPAFGGWCAWAMLEGDKVDVNPERFKIINGVNYLFYDGFWGNTLAKWNKLAETKTEPVLVRQADEFWQKITKE